MAVSRQVQIRLNTAEMAQVETIMASMKRRTTDRVTVSDAIREAIAGEAERRNPKKSRKTG